MLDKLIGPVTGLLDKFIEDKDQRNALAHEIATMSERHAQEISKGQLEVNKVEAAHKSLFVSGWRPAIGWICGFALMYSTILAPILGIWFTVPAVDSLEKDIETMKATVAKAELMTANLNKLDGQLNTISREIEDLWKGMDYLSNPLK